MTRVPPHDPAPVPRRLPVLLTYSVQMITGIPVAALGARFLQERAGFAA
ncbi:hypothetical protein GKQ77_04520 [Streptomyces sp. BG9H]|uniref:MFS transporter n=1 Tax=Streptomyces anatolicus TaxID=2675858 RepID=A0ABS6YIF2_9ACTN|nr:hypothetical protein [Streptomyces anatolicus]MBW5420834.1 hypothetical protein [Streptomyces anatolicus]